MELDFLMGSELMGDIPPLDPKIKEWLRQQTITEKSPGRIFKDWQILLEFIGSDGVEVSEKNNYFPMKILSEINARLSTPIDIDLKRPQQKSYPYIHGLYLLLRRLGLVYPRREGKKSKLIINQELLTIWQQLNITERYLILLELWIFWASSEAGSLPSFLLFSKIWTRLPAKGIKITSQNAGKFYLEHLQILTYLAILDLFGLVKLQQGKPLPGKGWCLSYIEKTPFGEAMMSMLVHCFMNRENEDFDNDLAFGELQPLLQEIFPDYQHQFILHASNKSR